VTPTRASIIEQAETSAIFDSAFGQTAHAPLQAVVGDFLQVRRCLAIVNRRSASRASTFAQIARHTGWIIDQRQFFTTRR